jgi:beta-aspartyl-peptidase (threonine type)
MTESSSGSADGITSSWGAEGGSWSVLVHGGAGDVPDERVAHHVEGCKRAAAAAADVLRAGGRAIDAVQRAVEVLEDDPSFNAGTGACLNERGLIELDASIMEGTTLRAGGVCALPPFEHPIAIARAVLEQGRHVLLAGEGAARFAVDHGFIATTSRAMTTERARERWKAVKEKGEGTGWAGGTVGAVARDVHGGVAAATSTGGRVGKAVGRVGDSPVPGAGNYACDAGGAASATGDGEAVLRLCLGKQAVDLLEARTLPVDAATRVVSVLGRRLGGSGGVILVDKDGRVGLARNTRTMTWACAAERLASVEGGH